MWDLIVSVPDHCLFFFLLCIACSLFRNLIKYVILSFILK